MNEELQLDSGGEASGDADIARALHRIVRSMHDGHCPACGHLAPAEHFAYSDKFGAHNGHSHPKRGHRCPKCRFHITEEQEQKALAAFRPYLKKSVEIWREWVNELH